MRSLTRVLAFVCLFALLSMAGCQKLEVEKTYKMSPGQIQIMEIDPPKRDQDVSVAITATGPLDVYIAKDTDAREANEKIAAPKNPLGAKQGIEKDTVTAKVPAKTGYGIVLLNAKKKDTDVTLKLTAK